MACACQKGQTSSRTFVYTDKSGKTKVYRSETEARAAVARGGGSYRAQG